jgi:hypothetical protein
LHNLTLPRCSLRAATGRSRQWLGAVQAAGAGAANDRPPALGTLEGTYQSNCSMPGSGTPWSFRLVGSVMRAAGVVGLVLLVALVVGVVFASNFSLNA